MSTLTKLVDFEGALTFGTIEMLLSKLRDHQKFHEIPKPVRKRLYSIFVESIDNIHKYAARYKGNASGNRYHPSIHVEGEGGVFRVRSGNLVLNDSISNLTFKIDRVNQLDTEALKSLYEEVINKDMSDKDTGAGLGLITMAMRTDRRIQYRFTPVDEHYSYFELDITVKA